MPLDRRDPCLTICSCGAVFTLLPCESEQDYQAFLDGHEARCDWESNPEGGASEER
jgi:hypothetical protein